MNFPSAKDLYMSHPDHPTSPLSPRQAFESWLQLSFLQVKTLTFGN